jgi:CubicO group peptidase (beta-lactamase class C family)
VNLKSDVARGIGRRRLLGWGGLAAGAPFLAGAAGRIPAAARTYGDYVARLAAEGRFSGVVMLSHHGRTVLSRAYGMADEERGIRNHQGTAFALSSAGKPFNAVAILQLAQQGRLRLTDTVGRHLRGFGEDVANQVTIHQMLTGTSGMNTPAEDIHRIFQSRDEVHRYQEQWARRSKVVGRPGLPNEFHAGAETAIPALIVEAVSGQTYWDYVEQNIFRRSGMNGSAFFTRPRWLTDTRLAHPYMTMADGSRLDAIRNLGVGSPKDYLQGRNPGRAFIDAIGDGGFATAPDLVRFVRALSDGTLLDRPWADVLTSPKVPHGPASFGTYGPSAEIVAGQWSLQRAGGNPGIGANWSVYPDTGWVGVILANRDDVPLVEMIEQETRAVIGAVSGGGR